MLLLLIRCLVTIPLVNWKKLPEKVISQGRMLWHLSYTWCCLMWSDYSLDVCFHSKTAAGDDLVTICQVFAVLRGYLCNCLSPQVTDRTEPRHSWRGDSPFKRAVFFLFVSIRAQQGVCWNLCLNNSGDSRLARTVGNGRKKWFPWAV